VSNATLNVLLVPTLVSHIVCVMSAFSLLTSDDNSVISLTTRHRKATKELANAAAAVSMHICLGLTPSTTLILEKTVADLGF